MKRLSPTLSLEKLQGKQRDIFRNAVRTIRDIKALGEHDKSIPPAEIEDACHQAELNAWNVAKLLFKASENPISPQEFQDLLKQAMAAC